MTVLHVLGSGAKFTPLFRILMGMVIRLVGGAEASVLVLGGCSLT